MTGAQIAGSPILYVLIAAGLLSVIVFALYSFSKAKKRCLELGMTQETISNVVKSTVISSLVPSFAILLGFLILAVSLGPAWPWWRLSVIGSLSYETMAANYTAQGIGVQLSEVLSSDASVFAAVMFVMTFGVIFAPILAVFLAEKYSTGVMQAKSGKGEWGAVLSEVFFIAMFAVYVPILIFTDLPTTLTLFTSLAVSILLGIAAKKAPVLNNFIMAIVLIVSMASSVLWCKLFL